MSLISDQVEYDDVLFDVELHYQAEEVATFNDPGWGEEYYIESIKLNGSDVELVNYLSEKVITEMEDKLYFERTNRKFIR